jgi:rhodanese-related sulfurtransferase/DNA-binding transcriptional ArsR family regulator
MSNMPFLSIRSSKTELFDQFARIGKALSSGLRIEILDLLAQAELSVEVLAQMLGQSTQNISQHLQVLRQCKLITSRKEGNFVIYRVTSDEITALVAALQEVAHTYLSEVDEILERFASHHDEFEALDAAELIKRARDGSVMVYDVRPPKEFATGHLPGAVNVPLSQLEEAVKSLPPGAEVVAYCRGKYCLMAYAAVDYLKSIGVSAHRLDVGFSEWRLDHLPVESELQPRLP